MLTITPKELAILLETKDIELIDVRGTWEYDEVHVESARNIPLHLLPLRINEIDKKKQVVFICRSGARSMQACQFAEEFGIQGYNLVGGTIDYEKEFPKQVVHGEKKKIFWIF